MTELLDYYIVKTARLWLILWNYPIDESSVVKTFMT